MINKMKYHSCSYAKKYVEKYGEVPFGYNIHHIDGNHKNNSLSNLIAIPTELHKKYHDNEKNMIRCFLNGNKTGFVYHSDVLIEIYNHIQDTFIKSKPTE